ncbi:peroxiredoxin-like 2A [Symsagittifera roscoffensis]|uniref:peroxiredoxin-like 2A n=1 Tax=Symsagittifera roscoffensis TaxID=84072 RepID=UPI00307CB18C
MEANGYSLHAVLHEELGWEEFATLFHPHPVYHDVQRRFYGPDLRRESTAKLLNPSVMKKVFQSLGSWGNLKGDGLLMGSVFAISSSGVIFEHREKTFGDEADRTQLIEAIKQHKLN